MIYNKNNGAIIPLRESSLYSEEELMTRKELFEKHHIHQLSDGRWRGFKNGKRIHRKNLNDLIDELQKDDQTILSLWDDFIEYRSLLTRSNTIAEYQWIYRDYLCDSEFAKKPIKDIKKHDFKLFFFECNSKHAMKKRYWDGIRGFVSQFFEWAREKEYAEINPTKDFQVPENVFAPAEHKSPKKLHFLPDEKDRVKALFFQFLVKTGNYFVSRRLAYS